MTVCTAEFCPVSSTYICCVSLLHASEALTTELGLLISSLLGRLTLFDLLTTRSLIGLGSLPALLHGVFEADTCLVLPGNL